PVAPQQTFKLVDLSTTGIGENQLTSGIHVFPNPSQGTVNITIEEAKADLKIATLQGEIVFEKTIKQGLTKCVTDLKAGFYLLIIQSTSGTFSQKLIIQHR
ncbi:MAG TPA: T9SS type A sorting domain-containing protein, partial [Sunxiuqinia sp.]|nr:T9SS type A sorting domain-containing protein [Sunxiuqinia sp.]